MSEPPARERAPLPGAPPPLGVGWPGRLGEALLATWTVAGALIAVVWSIEPALEVTRDAPWLVGPGLWVATALGAGAILRRLPTWRLPARRLAAAALVGAAADAAVVATVGPWPGLVVGVLAFSAAAAVLGAPEGDRVAGAGAGAVRPSPEPGR